jgi:hypothetical protein
MNHQAVFHDSRSARRRFLTRTAATTSALALPVLLTSCATGGKTDVNINHHVPSFFP